MRDRVVTARADPLSGGQRTDGVDVADNHPRTDCRKRLGQCPTDPRAGTGHDGDTPLDLH